MQKGNLEAKWQIRKACLFSHVSGLPGSQSIGLAPFTPGRGNERTKRRWDLAD